MKLHVATRVQDSAPAVRVVSRDAIAAVLVLFDTGHSAECVASVLQQELYGAVVCFASAGCHVLRPVMDARC
jgi:hypothetical protein